MKTVYLLFALIITAGCQSTSRTSDNQQLEFIIAQYQNFQENSSPFNKQEQGNNNRRLPDVSPENLAKNHNKLQLLYKSLTKIDVNLLTNKQKVNYSVLTYSIKNQIDNYLNKEHYMPLTAESGFHVYISRVSSFVKMNSIVDYQDYIARIKELPRYFDQQMFWMNKGMEEGITQPAISLKGFEHSISAFIKAKPELSEYYLPFKTRPGHISTSEFKALQKLAIQTINESVFTSYQKYYDFMVNKYLPNARINIAAGSLPNGKSYYNNRVAHYTTLALTADEVHQTGLKEVNRIKQEMLEVIKKVNFEGEFSDFVNYLRTNEKFYAKSSIELLKEAAFIAKKADAKLPQLFNTLPRTPYGVAPVPKNIAPKYTTGRYVGAQRKDQAGYYWVNTYRLDRRPLYVLEALTLHEAVPGHHLQISLARELDNLPKFRRDTYISAFGEGWGLYSEYLGKEMGFYQDLYSEFGRLSYEMWRACRLVVDTGIHAKGWSRKKAIDYLAKNTALSLHNVTTEIDRYITWPGQALSYKIGELTIKALRKQAETALGEYFDIKSFHDEILKRGSMPLSSLETMIDIYIKKEKEKIEKEGKARKVTLEL